MAALSLLRERAFARLEAMTGRWTEPSTVFDFALRLAEEAEAAKDLVEAARALEPELARVEWAAEVDCPECGDGFRDHPGCPWCGYPRHMGHASECALVRLRAALAAVKP